MAFVQIRVRKLSKDKLFVVGFVTRFQFRYKNMGRKAAAAACSTDPLLLELTVDLLRAGHAQLNCGSVQSHSFGENWGRVADQLWGAGLAALASGQGDEWRDEAAANPQ